MLKHLHATLASNTQIINKKNSLFSSDIRTAVREGNMHFHQHFLIALVELFLVCAYHGIPENVVPVFSRGHPQYQSYGLKRTIEVHIAVGGDREKIKTFPCMVESSDIAMSVSHMLH